MNKLLALICILVQLDLCAQTTKPPSTTLSGKEFDSWVTTQFDQWRKTRTYSETQPIHQTISTAVLERLGNHLVVLDSSIMDSVSLTDEYLRGQPGKIKVDYTPKVEYLKRLLPFTDDRPILKARLLRTLGTTTGVSKADSMKFLAESADLLKKSRASLDNLWLTTSLRLAQDKMYAGDKDGADAIFTEIVGYNRFEHVNSPQMSEFTQIYEVARKGQITCRKGNIEKLNRVQFLPYELSAELREYLAKCKAEAVTPQDKTLKPDK